MTCLVPGPAVSPGTRALNLFLPILLALGFLQSGCDECAQGQWRCHANQMQECYCDETPCVWDRGYPPCEEGTMCAVEQHEDEDVAACVTSEPCPDGESKSHCRDNTRVDCVGGFFNDQVACPDDAPCIELGDAAYCGSPPGQCVDGTLAACRPGDTTYAECEDGYYRDHT